jgi:hypothetical protein
VQLFLFHFLLEFVFISFCSNDWGCYWLIVGGVGCDSAHSSIFDDVGFFMLFCQFLSLFLESMKNAQAHLLMIKRQLQDRQKMLRESSNRTGGNSGCERNGENLLPEACQQHVVAPIGAHSVIIMHCVQQDFVQFGLGKSLIMMHLSWMLCCRALGSSVVDWRELSNVWLWLLRFGARIRFFLMRRLKTEDKQNQV